MLFGVLAGENLKEFFYDSFEGWYVLSGASRFTIL